MALDYKVVKDNSGFSVIENKTEQVVKSFNNHQDAKKFMKFLNLGGGFAGWTPSFMLKSIKTK